MDRLQNVISLKFELFYLNKYLDDLALLGYNHGLINYLYNRELNLF